MIFPEVAITGAVQKKPGLWEREWQRFFCFAHPFRNKWRCNLYWRILCSVNHYHRHPVLAILAKTSQALWKRSKLARKLGMILPRAQDYRQMSLISEANTNDPNIFMILTQSSDNGYIWQNLTGRRQRLCYSLLKTWQSFKLKSSFLPACGFYAVQFMSSRKELKSLISLCSPCESQIPTP